MKRQLFRLRLGFNNRLQGGIGGYLIMLFIALVLLALTVTLASMVDPAIWWNIAYALGINPVEGMPAHTHIWLYMTLGVCGALVFGGLMVTVFTSGVERYVERVRGGLVRYSYLSDHVVVYGWNPMTTSLLHQICGKEEGTATIVLLTGQDAVETRAALRASLPSREEQRVIIYSCGTELMGAGSLALGKAKALYITTDGEAADGTQMSQLTMLGRIAAEAAGRKEGPLPVYMMINDVATYNTLLSLDLPAEYYSPDGERMTVDLHMFNPYENWARILWGYGSDSEGETLDFEPLEHSERHVHLVIVGFGEMGRALLYEALRVCHFANHSTTEITVIDPQAEVFGENFSSQYPHIDTIEDVKVDFIAQRVEAPEVRERLQCYTAERESLLTIAICLPNPDEALKVAVTLPEEVFGDTRILIRQSTMSIVPTGDRFPHMRTFGMKKESIDIGLMSDELAITINGLYKDNKLSESAKQEVTEEQFARWKILWNDFHETTESSRWASRYQADCFASLLPVLRRNDVEHDGELFERLSESEHRRWMAERVLAGWRGLKEGEKRDNRLRHHDCMKPYEELNEREKEMDRNVIRFANSLARKDS